MTHQGDESNHDECNVTDGENNMRAHESLQPNPNEPIPFLEVESAADTSVKNASANKDPLEIETVAHSTQNESIEWLELEQITDGDDSPMAFDSVDSCGDGAAGYSADHVIESLEIVYAADADEAVPVKVESFNFTTMRTSLESTNTSDCVIVAEYQEYVVEVDDTDGNE